MPQPLAFSARITVAMTVSLARSAGSSARRGAGPWVPSTGHPPRDALEVTAPAGPPFLGEREPWGHRQATGLVPFDRASPLRDSAGFSPASLPLHRRSEGPRPANRRLAGRTVSN